ETKHRLSLSYHSQTNSLTEYFNRTLYTILVKYAEQYHEELDTYLTSAFFAYHIA
ncbi:19581_t:CDS:1, partial [Funneliformis geosporum]